MTGIVPVTYSEHFRPEDFRLRTVTNTLLSSTRRVSTIMAWISGMLFLVLAFYMTIDVTSRAIGGPFTGVADQFASFALALGGTWALARALTDGTHVRIDVFLPAYGDQIRSVFYIWSMLMATILGVVLAWQAWVLVGKSVRRSALVPQSLIDLPLAVPQSLAAIGFTMFAIQAAVMTLAATALVFRGQGDLQNKLESGTHGAPV